MKNSVYILNSLFFVLITIAGGVLFWVMPQQTISQDEKRKLTVMPTANVESVFSGNFGKQFDSFYNDHFAFRERWITMADQIKAIKGLQNQDFKVITPTPSNDIDVVTKPTANPNIANASASTVTKTPPPSNLDDEFSKVKGVVIVNGRVVQNFGGSKATIAPFADMLNAYRKTLDPSIKMYAMIIPAGSDFYLPQQVNHGVMKEKQVMDIFNGLLDSGITPVNAYDSMLPHKDEYIMFRTDHHWTGLGAYYAYTAFAQVAGFTPLRLEQMSHIEHEGTFLGSLYQYTHDEDLTKHPDTLDYYKIPNVVSVRVFNKGTTDSMKGSLYADRAKGYPVFLGGDFPLMQIKTDVPNDRKILIVKDSFGNALSTYLAANYSEVYVVDYRYFKGSIPQLMQDFGIQELLYAHNSFAANSKAVVKYGTDMLH